MQIKIALGGDEVAANCNLPDPAKLHLVATRGILEFCTPLDSARREQSIDVRFMRGTEIESVKKPFASFTKFGDFDCNAIYRLV